jgi:outer membrane cobalamin receptor
MVRRIAVLSACLCLLFTLHALAGIFGAVQGIVHDPDHRPIAGAKVEIHATGSDWHAETTSNALGEYRFQAIAIGHYTITVTAAGFAPLSREVTVESNTTPVVHFPLTPEMVRQSVNVTAAAQEVNPQSSTTETLVSRRQIADTPGAENTNSLAMITDYVPGAYMVHDQLHVRGGHQATWLIDGVPLPNTNIASNVGPQVDPKDIEYLEVQRGGLSAEEGDRTYAAFNVVPRSGFDRNRQGELVASYGEQHTTNDQLSFGSHTQRLGYFASATGYRRDAGLEPPVPQLLHDQAAGVGGFTSLTYNATANDQIRIVGSARGDHYQVPNSPEDQDAGIRDIDNERDAFGIATWVHTASPNLLFTVSPLYHFNRANYIGAATDFPVTPQDRRRSDYVGAHATVAYARGRNNARAGFDVFGERQNENIALAFHDGSAPDIDAGQNTWGSVTAGFVEDQFRATNWLSLNAGVRLTRYSGLVIDYAADPRLGAAVTVPKLGWVLRGFYGRYYQPPPLSSVSSSLAGFAAGQGLGFLPLHGERDRQYEAGLAIPVRKWTSDFSAFQTNAHNFFDHDVLGNSNIFFPLTIDQARIRGLEATVRSAQIANTLQLHLAYSHQFAQARGSITGGLSDFAPLEDAGWFYLDHDQRNTLSTGLRSALPLRAWLSANVAYGSGFLDGDGPAHLGSHTTLDVAVGKQLGESWSIKISALNLTNSLYLLDNSNTFGGTHWSYPRQVAVQVRYGFHY